MFEKEEVHYGYSKFSKNIGSILRNIRYSLIKSGEIRLPFEYDLRTFFELLKKNSDKILGNEKNFPEAVLDKKNNYGIEIYHEYKNSHLADIIVFGLTEIMQVLWSNQKDEDDLWFNVRTSFLSMAEYLDNGDEGI